VEMGNIEGENYLTVYCNWKLGHLINVGFVSVCVSVTVCVPVLIRPLNHATVCVCVDRMCVCVCACPD